MGLLRGEVKLRRYQEDVLAVALSHNTLVVLPTGLGKTMIALFLAVNKLTRFPEKKVLFLAPTKPLAQQHLSTFKRHLALDDDDFALMTGEEKVSERDEHWKKARVVFATPQTIQNEMVKGSVDLNKVSLIIFDEAHRAAGSYSYNFIAEEYKRTGGAVLALTASPGASRQEIEEVMRNLGIDAVEVKTEKDPDVAPYVQALQKDWVKVKFPENFAKLYSMMNEVLHREFRQLKSEGYLQGLQFQMLGKRDLLAIQGQLRQAIATDRTAFRQISLVAGMIKLQHAIELLETQGITSLYEYLRRLQKQKTKAAKNLMGTPEMKSAFSLITLLKNQGVEHPKLGKLVEIIEQELGEKRDARIIVFSHYRDTVAKVVETLSNIERARIMHFVGQRKGSDGSGLTQKRQAKILDEFRNGDHNVLVATSVAEEGLDIPQVDLVVFYEPIPSAIRTIQRRGRTARGMAGRLVILITQGTRDERYFWSAFHKERKMLTAMRDIRGDYRAEPRTETSGQSKLSYFSNEDKNNGMKQLSVIVDTREQNSNVVRELYRLGVNIEVKQLQVADYIVSERVAVERKTVSDFLQSLVDSRLMSQAEELVRNFSNPVMLIEGDPEMLYSERNIHANAIRGALASIATDFRISVLFTRSPDDTAAMLQVLAKREQDDMKREVSLRGAKRAVTTEEKQQFIVESLPNVSAVLSKRLLDKFGSVEAVFNADETQLQDVDGIADKKAKEIREVIRAKYVRAQ